MSTRGAAVEGATFRDRAVYLERAGALVLADTHLGRDQRVLHGHEPPAVDGDDPADPDLYVVGHDHPTIEIEGQRRPCYLHGRGCYRGADLLMLPPFTRLAAGTPVNGMSTADFISPLVTDADLLRPLVHDEAAAETLAFPPLGRFRELL